MKVFAYLGLVWGLMGFALGLLARGLLKDNLKLIPFSLAFLPWCIHLLYLVNRFSDSLLESSLLLFVGLSVTIALGVFWVGFRSLGRGAKSLAFLPIILLLLYGLGPVYWLSEALAQPLDLSFVPNLLLMAGTLSVTCMLLSYHMPRIQFFSGQTKKGPKVSSNPSASRKKRRQT